ncbi:MAG: helix-turn-helix domain-containing protein, partial [Actinomycetota bacterium]|nr:helix-turn-helix domain-containing protein [Actinomycetota bacterium]
MNVVIRRRAKLMGLIAAVALVFAVAYLWWFSQTESAPALLLGVLLSGVAVAHALAWGDARTPLLVADETGLRVRLGGDWTGLTWNQIETIEVDERTRFTDGHVAVLAADPEAALAQANLRSRLGARFNRFVYDAPLVVPFGLTTGVSVVDLPAALTRLADGRTPVIVPGDAYVQSEPTVEITATATSPAPPAVGSATAPTPEDASESAPERRSAPPGKTASEPEPGLMPGLMPEPDPEPESGSDPEPQPPAVTPAPAPVPVAGPTAPSGGSSRWLPWSRPSLPSMPKLPRLPLAGRRTETDAPAQRAVSALSSRPARREEVTMPVRREPATNGMLALSEPYADTEPLPEIHQLRRTRDDDGRGGAHNTSASNVSLIIDATTDLSARAMRKVRRPAAAPTTDIDSADVVDDDGAGQGEPLLIGGAVNQARMRLGLSIDELGERTRIRPFLIESIEVDDFAPCGGDFYARGHLRMLGRVLGIDPKPLVATYDKEFAAQPINARAVFDVELATGTTGMVRGGAPGSSWGALIATVLVIMLIWGVAQYFTSRPGEGTVPTPDTQNSAGVGSP